MRRHLHNNERKVIGELIELAELDVSHVIVPDFVENISNTDLHLIFVESEAQAFFSERRYEASAIDSLGRSVTLSLRTKRDRNHLVISELEIVLNECSGLAKLPLAPGSIVFL